MAGHRLTELQSRFCDHFMETGNAAEAARRAGYKSAADVQGHRALHKPSVQAELAKRRGVLAKRHNTTMDGVALMLREASALARQEGQAGAAAAAAMGLAKLYGFDKPGEAAAPASAASKMTPAEVEAEIRRLERIRGTVIEHLPADDAGVVRLRPGR